MSSNESVVFPRFKENTYKKLSFLPNTNPKWEQTFDVEAIEIVSLAQTAILEERWGSNLKRRIPEQELISGLLLESTKAMGEGPELMIIDLIRE